MKATVHIESPDEVEATIAFTMTLQEWKCLLKDLRSTAVRTTTGDKVAAQLSELVARTTQTILAQEVQPEEKAE